MKSAPLKHEAVVKHEVKQERPAPSQKEPITVLKRLRPLTEEEAVGGEEPCVTKAKATTLVSPSTRHVSFSDVLHVAVSPAFAPHSPPPPKAKLSTPSLSTGRKEPGSLESAVRALFEFREAKGLENPEAGTLDETWAGSGAIAAFEKLRAETPFSAEEMTGDLAHAIFRRGSTEVHEPAQPVATPVRASKKTPPSMAFAIAPPAAKPAAPKRSTEPALIDLASPSPARVARQGEGVIRADKDGADSSDELVWLSREDLLKQLGDVSKVDAIIERKTRNNMFRVHPSMPDDRNTRLYLVKPMQVKPPASGQVGGVKAPESSKAEPQAAAPTVAGMERATAPATGQGEGVKAPGPSKAEPQAAAPTAPRLERATAPVQAATPAHVEAPRRSALRNTEDAGTAEAKQAPTIEVAPTVSSLQFKGLVPTSEATPIECAGYHDRQARYVRFRRPSCSVEFVSKHHKCCEAANRGDGHRCPHP